MSNRYPRSILVTLCLGLVVAVAATLAVNSRQSGAEGYYDRARNAPITTQRLGFGVL